MNIDDLTQLINVVGFLVFVVLLLLAVGRMLYRLYLYRVNDKSASVILRRDFFLLFGLFVVFGISLTIRLGGWGLVFQGGWPRFLLVVVSDVVGLAALGYWTWVEYRVIGREGKEND